MSLPDTKEAIRRRLFIAAVRSGNQTPQFGFQICPDCGGRGSICVEREVSGRRSAAFEECPECHGETIVPA